jgi:sialic acid synthase SpsE
MTKIIAELCQNHNGDLNILDEMVSAAADSGADIVKIQSMLSSELTHRIKFDAGEFDLNGKIKTIKRPYKEEYERLKKLDLDDEAHVYFLSLCRKYKVKPMTTIFTRSRLKFLEKLNFETIKVSSFDCASFQMLEDLSKSKFKEIIVSTGCSYDDEIKKTSEILNNSNKIFCLLHCISIYPTPLDQAHLERINYLKKFSKNVGLSEHSSFEIDGLKISIASLLYKPKYIERHFTILDKSKTKDGPVSLNPNELRFLVKMSKSSIDEIQDYVTNKIKEFEKMKGLPTRKLTEVEILNRDYYRGRFASINKKNQYIYNWEDGSLN